METEVPSSRRGNIASVLLAGRGNDLTGPEQRPDPASPRSPALAELFEAEESPLLRFALRLVGERSLAEDLVQETFLRLHRAYDKVSHPRAWLYRSLRNLALNHLRDRKIEVELESGVHVAEQRAPGESLAHLEAVDEMRRLIAALPAPEQDLVRLKYVDGLKYVEIAQRTGLSIGHVGYKLHHLLKHLVDALRRAGIEGSQG